MNGCRKRHANRTRCFCFVAAQFQIISGAGLCWSIPMAERRKVKRDYTEHENERAKGDRPGIHCPRGIPGIQLRQSRTIQTTFIQASYVRDNRVPMSGYLFSKREPIGTSVHHIVICCGLPK
jgi:hypothetical protein